jgi:hypothetical protein
MKTLGLVTALVIVLAWPTTGEAQGQKKSKAKSAQTTQQKYVPRRAKVAARTATPCAARTWAGCQGWDPDPNVRSMIQMDAGRDDQP